MTLISGGKTIDGTSELLGSPRIKELVAEMKTRYPDRFVIFDVPPVLVTADALAFAPLVDYVIMVVQAGKTPLPDVQKALGMLPKEKVLGMVLNRHEASKKPYYYPHYRKK
jgi:non-specific protein-tyrosine kinase